MKLEIGKKYNLDIDSIHSPAELLLVVDDNMGTLVFSKDKNCTFLTIENKVISEHTEDWVPKEGEEFYYYDEDYKSCCDEYTLKSFPKVIETGNYYQTRELCQAAADKKYKRDVITHKLEKLAKRLNKGVKIDWEDEGQLKYSLYYDYYKNIIDLDGYTSYQKQIVIHCLSEDFKDEAIKEIGKDELESYLKGE